MDALCVDFNLVEGHAMKPRNSNWTLPRNISLVVVAAYVGLGHVYRGAESAFLLFGFCLFPLFCIWFPEAWGTFRGERFLGQGTKEADSAPPIMISVGGWILLATLPIAALIWLTNR